MRSPLSVATGPIAIGFRPLQNSTAFTNIRSKIVALGYTGTMIAAVKTPHFAHLLSSTVWFQLYTRRSVVNEPKHALDDTRHIRVTAITRRTRGDAFFVMAARLAADREPVKSRGVLVEDV